MKSQAKYSWAMIINQPQGYFRWICLAWIWRGIIEGEWVCNAKADGEKHSSGWIKKRATLGWMLKWQLSGTAYRQHVYSTLTVAWRIQVLQIRGCGSLKLRNKRCCLSPLPLHKVQSAGSTRQTYFRYCVDSVWVTGSIKPCTIWINARGGVIENPLLRWEF